MSVISVTESRLPLVSWLAERRQLWSIAAAVWLSFGLVQCLQSYVYAEATGRTWTLSGALIAGMPWWASWFILTPLIALLADRFAFPAARPLRSLAVHACAAVAISCVHLYATASVYWLTTSRFTGLATSLLNQVQRFFGSYFLESVVTYCGVAGVLMALDFARAVRDQAVIRARLEAQTAALESSVARARLHALSMELNPHFLFNTLSAIAGLVAQNRRAEARQVIQCLGELLRRTLGDTGPFNSVTREVELLEDYLFIQRVRFTDRLAVALEIADEARECLVPTMLLQPLVENAIRHGVEPREERVMLRISVQRDNGSLRLAVSDSGAGFTFAGASRPAREGIGISNTRQRLAHLYGDHARLTLRNRSEGGAEVIVTLPASMSSATSTAKVLT